MGHEVRVVNRFAFPKEWHEKWFDEYVLDVKQGTEKEVNSKAAIEKLLIEAIPPKNIPFNAIKSLPLPLTKNTGTSPYVVFIIIESGIDTLKGWRIVQSLTFERWMRLADYARSLGFRVVAYGSYDASLEEHLKEIGDEYVFIHWKEDHINKLLAEQIVLMHGAATSLALGGAFLLNLTFDGLPGIGYDGQLFSNFAIIANVINVKRPDLFFLHPPGLLSRKLNAQNYVHSFSVEDESSIIMQELITGIFQCHLEQVAGKNLV